MSCEYYAPAPSSACEHYAPAPSSACEYYAPAPSSACEYYAPAPIQTPLQRAVGELRRWDPVLNKVTKKDVDAFYKNLDVVLDSPDVSCELRLRLARANHRAANSISRAKKGDVEAQKMREEHRFAFAQAMKEIDDSVSRKEQFYCC
jgi:hypothetical protein